VIDVAVLRARIRESIKAYPDDSHGEGYLNSGKVGVLRLVADIAGDLDLLASCEPEGDFREIGPSNWCKTHIAPMGSRWCCDLAQRPWEWHDMTSQGATG
jgi:hypothetical protein